MVVVVGGGKSGEKKEVAEGGVPSFLRICSFLLLHGSYKGCVGASGFTEHARDGCSVCGRYHKGTTTSGMPLCTMLVGGT